MLIAGEWYPCDDGIIRPVLISEVQAADGSWVEAHFQLDIGADRTVFSADLLRDLGLSHVAATSSLAGVGGKAAAIVIDTQLRLFRETGESVLFRGQFAAFPDPAALDMSVLGRDITDLFAVIVDRPGDRVCLLGQRHGYRIEEK